MTWDTLTAHSLDGVTSKIEGEFQASAGQDLLRVVNVRYQDAAGPRRGHARARARRPGAAGEADTLTYLRQGDLDSTSGAGNDIRFDFTSRGILPDGGVVVAYHDSTHEDALFAV